MMPTHYRVKHSHGMTPHMHGSYSDAEKHARALERLGLKGVVIELVKGGRVVHYYWND